MHLPTHASAGWDDGYSRGGRCVWVLYLTLVYSPPLWMAPPRLRGLRRVRVHVHTAPPCPWLQRGVAVHTVCCVLLRACVAVAVHHCVIVYSLQCCSPNRTSVSVYTETDRVRVWRPASRVLFCVFWLLAVDPAGKKNVFLVGARARAATASGI